ncbi:MAG: hypothetical protein HQK91_04110 [Nitrospirae bacterium]|nr:hypothetical protein [Nitrospirota bacterium]
MGRKLLLLFSLMFVMGLMLIPESSQAMPMFARKYGADCTMCHTNVAQLNKVGFDFKAAGFRMPNEVGKDTGAFKMEDYWAGRISVKAQYSNHFDNTGASANYQRAGIEAGTVTLYPMTGAWGKNFGTHVELSISRQAGVEDPGAISIANLWALGVFGDENQFFTARVGTMEAMTAANSTATGSNLGFPSSLAITSKASGNPAAYSGSAALLVASGGTESGIELGYNNVVSGTSLFAKITDGIWYSGTGGVASDYSFGSYAGFFSSTNGTTPNRPSYGLTANQFIGDGCITAVWYNGLLNNVPFGLPVLNAAGRYVNGASTANDTTNRLSIYGQYWVVPSKITLIAGFLYGNDSYDNAAFKTNVLNGSSSTYSTTWFGDVEYHISPLTVFALSYSNTNPTSMTGLAHIPQITQVALGENSRFNQWMYLNTTFTYKTTQYTTGGYFADAVLGSTFYVIF